MCCRTQIKTNPPVQVDSNTPESIATQRGELELTDQIERATPGWATSNESSVGERLTRFVDSSKLLTAAAFPPTVDPQKS